MVRMGGINSLEAVIEHFKGRLDTFVGSFWDIVAALGRLKAATQGVVLSGQAVWAKLVGLLSIV